MGRAGLAAPAVETPRRCEVPHHFRIHPGQVLAGRVLLARMLAVVLSAQLLPCRQTCERLPRR